MRVRACVCAIVCVAVLDGDLLWFYRSQASNQEGLPVRGEDRFVVRNAYLYSVLRFS